MKETDVRTWNDIDADTVKLLEDDMETGIDRYMVTYVEACGVKGSGIDGGWFDHAHIRCRRF